MTAPGFAACLVSTAVGPTACQPADSGAGGQEENIAAVREQDGAGQVDQENHAAKGENTQDTGTPRGREAVPDIPGMEAGQETAAGQQGENGLMTADQWQIIPRYGIYRKGEPVLYVLDMDASQMRADEKEISARLPSAVFQDNVISVRVKFKDDTMTLIPDEKVREILKQEEKDRKGQGQGISVQWGDSYFCADSERNIHGRSAFQDRIRTEKEEQKTQGARAVAFDRIRGKGIDGLGFIRQRNSTSYKDNGKGGFYTSQVSENIIGKDGFTLDKPERVYKLWLDGSRDPIEIVLKKAPAYDSLEDIKGMVNHEGFYGMAEEIVKEDGLRLTVYACLEDGYKIGFSRGELIATLSDGRTAELVSVLGEQLTIPLDQLSDIQLRSIQETLYREPEDTMVTKASLHAEKPVVISPEQGSVLEIPIPGKWQPLDMVVEFRDCRIYLTDINLMGELYEYGTGDNGDPLTRHMVYINVRAKIRDTDKNLYYVSAVQPEKGQEGNSGDPIKIIYALANMAGVNKYNVGEPAGFKALYEEGESIIRLQLQRPTYEQNQEFVLPIQM